MSEVNKRPEIPSIKKEIGTKEIEGFQNNTLRPVIKQLHTLLLAHFSTLLIKNKGKYFDISADQKDDYILSLFQNEQRYKSELKGIIIGHFKIEEFNFYHQNLRVIDKRIYSIVQERILTNQLELEDYRQM